MTHRPSETEVRLGDALVAWLLSEMLWRLPSGSPAPDMLWDGAQSNFELACDALARHGALRAEGDYWRVLDSPTLASITTRRDLDRLLNAMACHAPYVDGFFPFGDPVRAQSEDLITICKALEDCGYMASEPIRSRWPWGTSSTVWYWMPVFDPWLALHNGLDWDHITPAAPKRVAEVLAAAPARALETLESRDCVAPSIFLRTFCMGWDGQGWRSSADLSRDPDAAIPHDGWDVALAAGAYLHLHGDASSQVP